MLGFKRLHAGSGPHQAVPSSLKLGQGLVDSPDLRTRGHLVSGVVQRSRWTQVLRSRANSMPVSKLMIGRRSKQLRRSMLGFVRLHAGSGLHQDVPSSQKFGPELLDRPDRRKRNENDAAVWHSMRPPFAFKRLIRRTVARLRPLLLHPRVG